MTDGRGDAVGGVLSHGHMFGLKSDVKSNVHYAEENVVIYPCGHSVVLLNLETRTQQLIHGTSSGVITALALTPNRRFLAISESAHSGKGAGAVNIYDAVSLKRRKMLIYAELGSPSIICAAFSGDGRFCLTQGGAPEWKLVLWTAEKAAKVICAVKVSSPGVNGDPAPAVSQADFCPADGSVVCVTGERILRFFRIMDAQFKPLPLNLKMELQTYTCHCWLMGEKVAVATDQGDLLIFENFEFRTVLASSPGDGQSVTSMAAFSKGFVAGGSEGCLRVYEQSDDPREFFKCIKTFRINGNTSFITNLAVSPGEDSLALTTSNNQIYSFALSNTDILKEDTMNFEHIMGPFPMPGKNRSGPSAARVNGVDVCTWKPLVATVSMDLGLRLWNYQEKSLELLKFFEETPVGVSLHPSGLFILIAFKEKVRLYSILMEDVRELKELTVKHCRTVSFSKGGQYFAFASNTQVHVYNTYTCQMIAPLKGNQGKVRSIVWRDQDRKILTASSEGQVYMWDASTGKRCQQAFQVADRVRILLTGTAQAGMPGAIRAYPIGQPGAGAGGELSPDFCEYPCLSAPVACMVQNHDGSLLFVGGDDGALVMYNVAEDGKAAEKKAREREAVEYTEEILVTRTELSIQSKAMQGLKNTVDELVLNNEYQLRLKDMNYKEKMHEVTEKFSVEVEMDRRRYGEILKFGAQIVDALVAYKHPVFVYIPPNGELRGGAWVVIDPTINEEVMEMYADVESRGGILEPPGICEVKFRAADQIVKMHQLDDILKGLDEEMESAVSEDDQQRVRRQIKLREEALLPMYLQVAHEFADLHDRSGRMKAKGVVRDILEWKTSREYFYWRTQRRLAENEVRKMFKGADPNMSFKEITAAMEGLCPEWDDDKAVLKWAESEKDTISKHVGDIRRDAARRDIMSRLESLSSEDKSAVLNSLE